MNSYIKSPLLPESNIAIMKAILRELSLESIDEQFADFKYTCFVAPEYIEKRIASLIEKLFKTKHGQMNFKYTIDCPLVDPITHISNPPYHFRVRKADPNKVLAGDFNLSDNEICESLYFAAMNCKDDIWARPSSMITEYGRLNEPNQSILYTSLEGSTTLVEADVNIGELFFMICYKRTKPIIFSDCSRFIAFNELTEEENLKRYAIFNLLRNEFVREFPKTYDKQSQYCLSSNIAKHFFINDDVDAIQYPSVKGLGAYNFAFFEDRAKECLTPICVKFCLLEERLGNREARIRAITNGFWQNNKFVWTPLNSTLSKELLNDPALDIFLSK